MNYKILVVDDEPLNIRLLERMFNRQYQVLSAASGQEALDLLKQHDVALIISDHRMPGMSGIEFLKRAAEMRPRVIRIIVSGYADVTLLTEAINSNVVYRFISKPWNNDDLQHTVGRALEHFEITKRQYDLEQTNERLTRQLEAMRGLIARLNVEFASLDDDAAFAVPPIEEDSLTETNHSHNSLRSEVETERVFAESV